MSAIDGLTAALVAAPCFVHPDEWVPLIFGGKRSRCARAASRLISRQSETSVQTLRIARPCDRSAVLSPLGPAHLRKSPRASGNRSIAP